MYRLVSRTIQLEENEKRLCDLLLEVTSFLRRSRPEIPPITCRVAGGWVRDKVPFYPHYYIPTTLASDLPE